MTLQLTLPAALEERLCQEAQRQGLSPDAVTLKLLDKHLPSADRRAALIAMLQQWNAEDEAMTPEESAANAEVLRAIDEERLSNRKLFTEILKDEPA
jgi:hypothetical protein